MGAFIVQFGDQAARAIPNCFHIEGLKRLVSVAHGLAASPGFLMSLTGLNIPGHATRSSDGQYTGRTNLHRRPDIILMNSSETLSGTYSWYPKLRPQTTYADVIRNHAHINGLIVLGTEHVHERIAVDMSSKPITFAVQAGEYFGRVTSSTVTFKNWAWASWNPTADKNTKEKGYYIKDAVAAPDSHGFPWCTPHLLGGTIDSHADVWATPHYYGDEGPDAHTWGLQWDSPLSPGVDSSYYCYIGGNAYTIVNGGSTSCRISASANGVPSYMHSDGPDVWVTFRPISNTAAQMDGNPWRCSTLPVRAAIIHTDEGENSKLIASCVFADDIRLAPGAFLTVSYRGILRELLQGVDGVE